MSSTLGDRLTAARRRSFVGRTRELARFADLVTATELPVAVLHVHGPAGSGKTALLRQFADVSRMAGVPVVSVDARDLPPTGEALAAQLREDTTGSGPPAAGPSGRRVVMVDTFELLQPVDGLVRDALLPSLGAETLVVLAGQNPPGPAWLADPGWSQLLEPMPLGNLTPLESETLLAARQVPEDRRAEAVRFTRGNPLALALVAETLANHGTFDPRDAPNVIATLLEQFVQAVPSLRHRHALEACALVRQLTEPLLTALVGPADDTAQLFGWLRRLPCVDSGRGGLLMQELAKDVVASDLEWRDPARFATLHHLARQYYLDRLGESGPDTQASVLMDLMFLHADLRPFLRPPDAVGRAGGLGVRPARMSDHDSIAEMVLRHEGPESAAYARRWLDAQPDAWQVVRDPAGSVVGTLCLLSLDADAADAADDPAVAGVRRELRRHPPLRPGERATLVRFWMARDSYQDVSPVQSLIAVQLGRHYLATPGPALSLLPFADPEAWAGFAEYADMSPMPDADFEVGGRRYGVYGHDWRLVTAAEWLSVLAQREVGSHPEVRPSSSAHVLAREDFTAGVRSALRDLTRPDRLRGSPLLGSRVVVSRVPQSSAPRDRVAALQQVILETTAQLKESTNLTDRRLHRVLYRAYVQPAPTLEKAAEALGLPSSTFRRHLGAAVQRVTDILWEQEVGA